jgi:hypothetical protein
MIKYYEVGVSETSKSINNKINNHYSQFNYETIEFLTIKEVKEYLKEKYGKVKRVKMYRDKKDGTQYQAGWIYCFKNKDYSHNSESWWQQDWVEAKEVEKTIILIN